LNFDVANIHKKVPSLLKYSFTFSKNPSIYNIVWNNLEFYILEKNIYHILQYKSLSPVKMTGKEKVKAVILVAGPQKGMLCIMYCII